ncbi:uncharacterized protein LOC117641640 [Thrips palmi]|uniref:Uncharacterized protein LOC117641640 n=1 Tax=Thrips palmi TaxID=161013 RepID=A0A6P8Y5Z5_THRPL|nr:uncharacterized protein LOC117641640 [Thrips palmi]
MKVLFAVAVLAVVLPATLSAPSGLLGLGGVVVAGPTTISRTSLVQTHPSPAVVVAAPALHGGIVSAAPWGNAVVAGPAGTIVGGHGLGGVVAVNELGLGHGGIW